MFKFIQSYPIQCIAVCVVLITPLLFQNCSPTNFLKGEAEGYTTQSSTGVYTGTTNTTELMDDHPDVATNQKLTEVDADLLLVDRRYARRIFEDFFGPASFSAAINDASAGMIDNATDFADVCSVYRQYRIRNQANNLVPAVAGENCPLQSGANGLGADVYSKPSVTRAGWIEQTCLNLVEHPTTFQYALKQVDASKSNPDLNAANILKIFKAFYRDRPDPGASILDVLLMHADPTITSSERWKAPIYAVCSSGYWQVL